MTYKLRNCIPLESLKLLTDYLTNRKQKTRVETSYSYWEVIKHDVPQGSILGPLLFNIFICDMFLMLDHTYFASYADDSSPYTVNQNAEEVIRTLKEISKPLLKWFRGNKMKLNPDKCHLILSGKVREHFSMRKLLLYVILITCIQTSRELQALALTVSYMDLLKRNFLMDAFFNLLFSYCPLHGCTIATH